MLQNKSSVSLKMVYPDKGSECVQYFIQGTDNNRYEYNGIDGIDTTWECSVLSR